MGHRIRSVFAECCACTHGASHPGASRQGASRPAVLRTMRGLDSFSSAAAAVPLKQGGSTGLGLVADPLGTCLMDAFISAAVATVHWAVNPDGKMWTTHSGVD